MKNLTNITNKEIVEQIMNVIFFNHLFEENETAMEGVKTDLEKVLAVYYPTYVITTEVKTNGYSDLIANVELAADDEIIKVRGELRVTAYDQ